MAKKKQGLLASAFGGAEGFVHDDLSVPIWNALKGLGHAATERHPVGPGLFDPTLSLFGLGGGPKPPSLEDQVQKLISGLPGSEQIAPDAATVQSLSDALRNLKGKDFTSAWSNLPPSLQGDVTKVWQGQTPAQATAVTPSTGLSSNDLAGLFGQIFQKDFVPFMQTEQQMAVPGENASIASLRQALKGASPQVRAQIGTLPDQLQAEQGLMNRANTDAALSAPMLSTLLSGLNSDVQAQQAARNTALQQLYTQQGVTANPFNLTLK